MELFNPMGAVAPKLQVMTALTGMVDYGHTEYHIGLKLSIDVAEAQNGLER